MKCVAWKKGMGMVGIFLILLVATFIFTMIYIVIYNLFMNLLPSLTDNASTLAYYQSCFVPVMKAIPFFFLFSIVVWGLIQSQNPFSMFSIGGVWVVITFAWFSYAAIFMFFDFWMMTEIPSLIPAQATYWIAFYSDFVVVLWRDVTWAVAIVLFFFGLWMASTRYEQTGPAYGNSGGYY
jgi:hypothetical protein